VGEKEETASKGDIRVDRWVECGPLPLGAEWERLVGVWFSVPGPEHARAGADCCGGAFAWLPVKRSAWVEEVGAVIEDSRLR